MTTEEWPPRWMRVFRRSRWGAPVLAVVLFVVPTAALMIFLPPLLERPPAPPPCWGIVYTTTTRWSTVHRLEGVGLVMCTETQMPLEHPGDRIERTRTVCTRMDRIDQSHCARDFERIP